LTGNTSRVRGRARELAVVKGYRARGWVAYRLAHGHADIIAMRAGYCPELIQVKSTLRPYTHFPHPDRQALAHEAHEAGAHALLAWWPKNGPLTFIPAVDWPAPRPPFQP
jgi:Holliday junction resolvase